VRIVPLTHIHERQVKASDPVPLLILVWQSVISIPPSTRAARYFHRPTLCLLKQFLRIIIVTRGVEDITHSFERGNGFVQRAIPEYMRGEPIYCLFVVAIPPLILVPCPLQPLVRNRPSLAKCAVEQFAGQRQ